MNLSGYLTKHVSGCRPLDKGTNTLIDYRSRNEDTIQPLKLRSSI